MGAGTPGGRADGGGHTGWMSGRGWTMDGQADGQAGRRTGGRQIFEGKTPDLTWPWEIQRGRPWVTVKLPDLPLPSR